jgi:hypothetical protein
MLSIGSGVSDIVEQIACTRERAEENKGDAAPYQTLPVEEI